MKLKNFKTIFNFWNLDFFKDSAVENYQQRDSDCESCVRKIEIRNDGKWDEVGDFSEENSFREVSECSAENERERNYPNFRFFFHIFHEKVSQKNNRKNWEQNCQTARERKSEREIRILREFEFQKREDFNRLLEKIPREKFREKIENENSGSSADEKKSVFFHAKNFSTLK